MISTLPSNNLLTEMSSRCGHETEHLHYFLLSQCSAVGVILPHTKLQDKQLPLLSCQSCAHVYFLNFQNIPECLDSEDWCWSLEPAGAQLGSLLDVSSSPPDSSSRSWQESWGNCTEDPGETTKIRDQVQIVSDELFWCLQDDFYCLSVFLTQHSSSCQQRLVGVG